MLTDEECAAPNTPEKRQKRADSRGLYLMVTPTGRRSWAWSYRFDGKQRTLPLGPYTGVSIAEARFRVEQARAAIHRGEDPGARTQRQAKTRAAVERSRRFGSKPWSPRAEIQSMRPQADGGRSTSINTFSDRLLGGRRSAILRGNICVESRKPRTEQRYQRLGEDYGDEEADWPFGGGWEPPDLGDDEL